MFSQIKLNVNLDVEPSTNVSDKFSELVKLSETLHVEYEEAKDKLEKNSKEINYYNEQLNSIEIARVKLKTDLALQIQMKQDFMNTVESRKNTLQSTEFDLKKYNKLKLCTADLDTLSNIKKTFITYKSILKIHFDYSNGANAIIQKGYIYNKISKKLAYFEFNTDEQTSNEVSVYLWNKIKLVSEESWNMLAVK